jgi:hypothetical protein
VLEPSAFDRYSSMLSVVSTRPRNANRVPSGDHEGSARLRVGTWVPERLTAVWSVPSAAAV